MKRPILFFVIILLAVGLGTFIYEITGFANVSSKDAGNKLELQQENTGVYFIELPSGLDTMNFEATISLDPTKKFHLVKLPSGGTETNVSIYDSTFLETIQQNTLPKITPLLKGDFFNDQEVLLNITRLNRGKYFVHYLSCGLGGIFPLTIK